MAFEYLTIKQSNNFGPFNYWTSPEIRSPLRENIYLLLSMGKEY